MRLFAAVDLSDHVKEQLTAIVNELRACRADVRWVHTASMHVTLKFLGTVEPREVGAIDAALSRSAGAAAPTRGRLRNVGSFPHLRRPRVLWVGLETADERLPKLHSSLEDAFVALGFRSEKRRFDPHVTIGRVRGNRGLRELQRAVETVADLDLGWVKIDAVTLFESELRRTGAVYTALGRYELGRPRS